jgi:hypothetical protein
MPNCPQCQSPYQEGQRYCSMCGSSLLAPGEGEGRGQPPRGAPPWCLALLVAAGVIIVVLLVLLLRGGAPLPPVSVTPAPPAAPGGPPVPEGQAPAPGLREELQKLLSTLREAQLNKDSSKFLSCYSVSFPELDQKRRDTLASWANYDYTGLVYTIEEIRPIDANSATAQVSWYIDAKNLKTKEISSFIQTYQVRFVRESGQWRIRSLEEVE